MRGLQMWAQPTVTPRMCPNRGRRRHRQCAAKGDPQRRTATRGTAKLGAKGTERRETPKRHRGDGSDPKRRWREHESHDGDYSENRKCRRGYRRGLERTREQLLLDSKLVAQVRGKPIVRTKLLRNLQREAFFETSIHINRRQLVSSASGRVASSRSSRWISASSASRWELTETYSPTAMDIEPATRPARPATRMALFEAADAAMPIIRLAVDTMASSAPSTAARSQRARPLRCTSPCRENHPCALRPRMSLGRTGLMLDPSGGALAVVEIGLRENSGSLDQPVYEQYQGQAQQQVNQSPHRIGGDEPKDPKNQQHSNNRPQHGSTSLSGSKTRSRVNDGPHASACLRACPGALDESPSRLRQAFIAPTSHVSCLRESLGMGVSPQSDSAQRYQDDVLAVSVRWGERAAQGNGARDAWLGREGEALVKLAKYVSRPAGARTGVTGRSRASGPLTGTNTDYWHE